MPTQNKKQPDTRTDEQKAQEIADLKAALEQHTSNTATRAAAAEPASIYARLVRVMRSVQSVSKDDFNTHQKFNFRGIDAVVNAVGPALREHEVIVMPTVQQVEYAAVTTSNNKAATATRLLVTYTFYGPDGDSASTTVAGEAWDHGDKATPKAMSVAMRIALLQALALPTDQPDPDHDTYEQAAYQDPAANAKAQLWSAWCDTHSNLDHTPLKLGAWYQLTMGEELAGTDPGKMLSAAGQLRHLYAQEQLQRATGAQDRTEDGDAGPDGSHRS